MMSSQLPDSGRRRDAAATRAAILVAARQAFTDYGYDGASMRTIAQLANANLTLLTRYFGNKAGLFAHAVADTFDGSVFEAMPKAQIGRLLAEQLVGKAQQPPSFDPTLAMLRSCSVESARAAIEHGLRTAFAKPLARAIGGPDAALRAGLIIATLAGFAMMRDVIHLESLSSANQAQLAERIGRTLQTYVDG